MSDPTWYIRVRGRISGPFDRSQLEALRKRGQFARFHEISQDRQSWVSASTLGDLFDAQSSMNRTGDSVVPSAAVEDLEWFQVDPEPEPLPGRQGGFESAPSVSPDAEWFYAAGSTAIGPIPLSELERLLERGEIADDTLVWRGGMAQWSSFGQVFGTRTRPAAPPHPAAFPSVPPPSHETSVGWRKSAMQSPAVQPVIVPQRTSGLAIASFVLSLVWVCGFGSLLAVIFALVALGDISRSRGRLGGTGLAVAGLILGLLGSIWLGIYVFLPRH
jgi:hypothetical protein